MVDREWLTCLSSYFQLYGWRRLSPRNGGEGLLLIYFRKGTGRTLLTTGSSDHFLVCMELVRTSKTSKKRKRVIRRWHTWVHILRSLSSSVVGKVFCKILNHKLMQCLDKKGASYEGQAGFRINTSCKDNVYTLNEIVKGI